MLCGILEMHYTAGPLFPWVLHLQNQPVVDPKKKSIQFQTAKCELPQAVNCLYSICILFRTIKWQPIPVFLPGKSHGRRNLVGYSPWGRKEWGMTEQLHHQMQIKTIARYHLTPIKNSLH